MQVQQSHNSFTAVKRGSGHSSVAASAYLSGQEITDQRTGEVHDYSAKTEGVEHAEIFLPENVKTPDWMKDRNALWNENEKAHKRGDSVVARSEIVDFPHELSQETRLAMIREYAQDLSNRYGVAVDVGMHTPDKNGDERNYHAHLLFSTKQVNELGFGNKAIELDPIECQRKKLENIANYARPKWAEIVNRELTKAGIEKHYEHRTLDVQRKEALEKGDQVRAAELNREPTKHLGRVATAIDRRGEASELVAVNKEINETAVFLRREELSGNALERLTNRSSTFTERDLARALARDLPDRYGPERHAVYEHALGRPDLVIAGIDSKGHIRFTTTDMQRLEHDMVNTAKGREGEGRHMLDAAAIERHGQRLSDEQRQALGHIGGRDGVVLVEGMAGAGKSTMMQAAREAWEEKGYTVHGAALAGKAAQGLEEGAGIQSQTVHSLLKQIERGDSPLTSRSVLVVDEAGMLGSRQTAELVKATEQAGAKLVLVGDDRQLQPIDAGGAFKALKAELGAAELTTIYRQREEWMRESVHQFAGGQADKALAGYAERGLLTIAQDKRGAAEALVADWQKDRLANPEQSQAMLAGTRAEVRQLNTLAREDRIGRGEIDRGERVDTAHGQREFAAGDRMLFTRNDNALGVKNGTLATVEKVERQQDGNLSITARTDAGKTVQVDTSKYNNLDHGYAMTTHKSQGVTVDKAYVLAGSMHDRELSYVSMSRSRDETRLYADAKRAERLPEQMRESHQKGTSVDKGLQDRGSDRLQQLKERQETAQQTRAERMEKLFNKDAKQDLLEKLRGARQDRDGREDNRDRFQDGGQKGRDAGKDPNQEQNRNRAAEQQSGQPKAQDDKKQQNQPQARGASGFTEQHNPDGSLKDRLQAAGKQRGTVHHHHAGKDDKGADKAAAKGAEAHKDKGRDNGRGH